MTEVYLLFYEAVLLPRFTYFNKLLQHEEPLIYKLYDSQLFISKLASCFIKPSVIKNRNDSENSFFRLSLDYQDQQNDIEWNCNYHVTKAREVVR